MCNMPAIFGFECPTCGESLGAELPAKKMVITCSACGLDFAVKRPAKDKDVSLPTDEEVEEQQRLSQVNHWRQQRSRSIHKDENGVVDAARVKERLQARQATVAALNQPPHYTRASGEPKKGKGTATAQQGKGDTAPAATEATAAEAAGTGMASSSQQVPARDR